MNNWNWIFMVSVKQCCHRCFPLVLSFAVGLAAASIGCSKKKAAPAEPLTESAVVSVSDISTTTESAPAGATPEFPNPGLLKPGTINEDGVEVGAAALTDALQNYYYATAGQVPESLDAMVRLKIIARIPTPPKGKKYVLDRKKAVVTLENAR
jgi:hypothetical protein